MIEKSSASKQAVQALMGDADQEMTDHYLSGHEQRWVTAQTSNIDRTQHH
ncbi:hypothetical protein [Oceanospirillum multiglobuliferum]|nr:hypothetical protein [Oceanospirillum multiglobuliferum]